MNAGGGIDPGDVLSPKGVGATAFVKYGWDKASAAEMRSAGSNFRSLSSKSMACGEAFGKTCWNGIFAYRGNCLI